MKLKTNLFQGKKPTLEEGQAIYQIDAEDPVVSHVGSNGNCKRCFIQFMKMFLYTTLLLLILFLGFVVVMHVFVIDHSESRGICGTLSMSDLNERLEDAMRDSSAIEPKVDFIDDIFTSLEDDALDDFAEAELSTISNLSETDKLDEATEPSSARFEELLRRLR